MRSPEAALYITEGRDGDRWRRTSRRKRIPVVMMVEDAIRDRKGEPGANARTIFNSTAAL